MSDILARISATLVEGNAKAMPDLTRQALGEGLSAEDVLNQALTPGMDQVGQAFKRGDMYVPDVLASARAMQASMDILRPILLETGARRVGKVVVGTVQGDLHDIGKNLVAIMLEGAGFEVIDLGKDVAPAKFVDAVKNEKPDLVAMSALLTTTMRVMGAVVKALQEAGLRDHVKVIVGGAPVTRQFAEQIGADGYASNASNAAALAKQLTGV